MAATAAIVAPALRVPGERTPPTDAERAAGARRQAIRTGMPVRLRVARGGAPDRVLGAASIATADSVDLLILPDGRRYGQAPEADR